MAIRDNVTHIIGRNRGWLSGVFLLKGDDSLEPMQPAEFSAEADFQRLLTSLSMVWSLAPVQIGP
jgi:hypothetical protein